MAARSEARADIDSLFSSFKENAAKLIFNGVSADELKKELDNIYREVARND